MIKFENQHKYITPKYCKEFNFCLQMEIVFIKTIVI